MKILLAHMWMVIGGAETHVVELSRELTARGHDVTVASFGGMYVKQLEEAGVKHVTVPLHSRGSFAITRSYFKLKSLIEKEKFDIVHAHSRIPAFVCGMLAKKLGFRFVTTAHGVFKVTPTLAHVSDWGDHAFAVSCDIKQYLINNYGVSSDNITLTVNGIDTNRFCADVDGGKIRSELGIRKDAFTVVSVSRIDQDTVPPCFELCDAAFMLGEKIPSLEVVIVGGGNAFAALKTRVELVNSKLGRKCIHLTGPRTDIPDIVACADAFLGVSRSGLEAMSAEKPVIFAGPAGYAGIFRDEIKSLARLTNFTFRGERLPNAELMMNDILSIYNMSQEERQWYGKLGREEVMTRYSLTRMAQDHIEIYEKLSPYQKYKHGDIIISGYYGYDNVGDHSLLPPIVDGIRRRLPEAKVTVLARRPQKVARICKARTINRFNIFSVLREMKHAKLLISGGGSLLQDGTSRKSLFYYAFIMKAAKKRGMRVMIYANGLGPLMAPTCRETTAQVVTEADYVSLRERASLKLLNELSVSRDVKITADPAILLEATSDLWIDYIQKRDNIEGEFFFVSIKDGNNFDGTKTGRDFLGAIAHDLRYIADKYSLMPLFVPMYPSRDTMITKQLADMVGCGRVLENLTASEICGLVGRARFVVGTRLHMLVFSASMAIPLLGITYDPKIDAFLDYIDQRDKMLDIRDFSEGELVAAVEKIIENEQSIREHLSLTAKALRKKATEDCDAVEVVYNKK